MRVILGGRPCVGSTHGVDERETSGRYTIIINIEQEQYSSIVNYGCLF
jgi:hypothetical protein